MEPFVVKPGESIVGLGLDFATRLAAGETITNVTVAAVTGITIDNTTASGTKALASITIAANAVEGDNTLWYTATGTAGSIRKGYRTVRIKTDSN